MEACELPLIENVADVVGSDPLPVSQIRDWRWLLENIAGESDKYIDELEERGIVPDFGIARCSSRRGELHPVDDDLIRAEFANQHILLRHRGVRYRLAPAEQFATGVGCLQQDVAFVSLTHRILAPTEVDVLWPAPEGLQVVGAIDAQRRWTDRMVAGPPELIGNQAAATNQPY